MGWLIAQVLMAVVAFAIPILAILAIGRVIRWTRRLRDPGRLERLFADSVRDAMRRAGADPSLLRTEIEARARPAPPPPRTVHPPVARPIGGLDLGETFRLSEPPEIVEPHRSLSGHANWIAIAALAGAGLYYLLRII